MTEIFTKLNNNNVFTNNISMQHFLHFYHKLLEHKVQFSVIMDPQNTLACFVTSSCVHTTVNLDDLCVMCAGAFAPCMPSHTSALTQPIVLLLHLAVCFHSPTCSFSLQIKSLHRPSAKTNTSCCNTTYSSACRNHFAMMCRFNNVSQGVAQQEPCSMELHSAQRPNKPPRISTTQSLS